MSLRRSVRPLQWQRDERKRAQLAVRSIGGRGCSERGYAGPATRQWSEKPSSPQRVRGYPHKHLLKIIALN